MGIEDWNNLQYKLFKIYNLDKNDTELIIKLSNKLRKYKNNELNLSTFNKCKVVMEEELRGI